MRYDVAIIGGGVAGLQAALTLARCLYEVVVIDAGKPAHAVASHMHNLIGADGQSPAEFYANAHAQLAAYPNVKRVQATVVDGDRQADASFQLKDDAGRHYHATSLLFACGVRDVLPPIEGLAPLWGKQVQHCAYCHGYEGRGKSSAILTPTSSALAMIKTLFHLTPTLHVLLEDGPPDDALAAELQRLNMTCSTSGVTRMEAVGEGLAIHLADGSVHACDVLYIRPGSTASLTLPQKFGCSMTQGGQIQTDEWGRAGVAGIYAAGDVATGQYAQLVNALKSGLDTAVTMHTVLSNAAYAAR